MLIYINKYNLHEISLERKTCFPLIIGPNVQTGYEKKDEQEKEEEALVNLKESK